MSRWRWLAPNQTWKYWTHALFLYVMCSNFLLLSSASNTAHRHMCVLDSNGEHNCNEASELSLQRLERISKQCGENDDECWCMKAISYTNDVRRRNGNTKMLKPGPKAQLQNAKRYAVTLASIGSLRHQDLVAATNEIGCERRIGAENIAYNYDKGDIAFSCVQQWENSPAHLGNILKDDFDEVVVGFYKAPNGRVYCVQTFAVTSRTFSKHGGHMAQCESVSVQEKPTQEVLNVQNDENIEEKAINEKKHAEPGDPIMSEEEVLESQEHPALQQEDGQSSDSDTETAYSTVKDFEAGESEADGNTESFAAVSNENQAKITINISADEGHYLNEYVQEARSELNDHAESIGMEEFTEGDESKQREVEEHEASETAIATEDHDSLEVDDQDPQDHENEKEDIVDRPMANEMKKSKRKRETKKTNVGNRACRCLELGERCWHSLGKQTDELCTPFLATKKQPTACKLKCCSHCLTKSKSRRCTNKVVKRLCRKMRKIIENEL